MQHSAYELIAWLSGIGAAIGLGQLFLSDEKVTLKRALGRALVTAGLSTGSASILIAIPGLPFLAMVGLAAAIATLGTAGLERLIQRYLPKS